MSIITNLLSNKYKRKVFIRSILIGMPLLIMAAVAVNYFEDNSAAKGTANEMGGKNYWYESTAGTENIPDAITAILPSYPGSTITYYNIQTDSSGFATGNITGFSKDQLEKIIDFYKSLARIENTTEKSVTIEKGDQTIDISKENILPDDRYKNQTKFGIHFRERKKN